MRRRAALTLALVVGLLAAAFALLGRDGDRALRPARHETTRHPRANVILLTIDTLRPDHLGAYGYAHPTSPHLDELARESVLFEDAVSSSAWTSPGLVSLLTGLFAVRHGVTGPAASVAPGTPTLATELAGRGYRVPNLVYLTSIPNYANLGFGPPLQEFFSDEGGPDELARWLEHGPEEPFFLWYHYRYVHLPYRAPESEVRAVWPSAAATAPVSEGLAAVQRDVIVPRDSLAFALPADREAVTRLYDGEVHAMDAWLGDVLARLERRGLLDRSVLAISADHGEELFDHGWVGHASTTLHATLFEELIRIPLLIRFPGGAHGGLRIAEPVRGVDLMPTLLDAVDVAAPTGLDGRSLLPLVRGETLPPAPAMLESAIAGYQTPPARDGERLAGIRERGWKLVLARGQPRARLFHVASDPRERTDLGGTGLSEETQLRTTLTRYLAEHDPGFFVDRPPRDATVADAVPADAPCPSIEAPRDGASLTFEADAGVVRARWAGRADLRYMLEYELGEGRFHTVGHMPLVGNAHDFGPYPREVWRSFGDFNPWRVRVVLTGREDCAPARVEFRFASEADRAQGSPER
ncbi:MAG: sulfatase [bacterium]